VLSASFALWSVASLLTPLAPAARGATAAARVAVGVAQGALIPAMHTVLSQVGGEGGGWRLVGVAEAPSALDPPSPAPPLL